MRNPTVRVDGREGEHIERVLGTRVFAVRNKTPERATVPEYRDPVDVYFIDVARLAPYQREQLARHYVQKYGGRLSDTRKAMLDRGVPVLAEYCELLKPKTRGATR